MPPAGPPNGRITVYMTGVDASPPGSEFSVADRHRHRPPVPGSSLEGDLRSLGFDVRPAARRRGGRDTARRGPRGGTGRPGRHPVRRTSARSAARSDRPPLPALRDPRRRHRPAVRPPGPDPRDGPRELRLRPGRRQRHAGGRPPGPGHRRPRHRGAPPRARQPGRRRARRPAGPQRGPAGRRRRGRGGRPPQVRRQGPRRLLHHLLRQPLLALPRARCAPAAD